MFDPFRAACLWVFGSLLQPGYCSPTAYSVLVFLSLGYMLLLSLKCISSNHHRPSASVFGPRSPRTNLPSGVVLYESSLLPRLRPVPVRSALIRTRPTPFRASCRVARRLRATMTWRPSAPWKSSISRPPSWAVRTCSGLVSFCGVPGPRSSPRACAENEEANVALECRLLFLHVKAGGLRHTRKISMPQCRQNPFFGEGVQGLSPAPSSFVFEIPGPCKPLVTA